MTSNGNGSNDIWVELTWFEIFTAARVGMSRALDNVRHKRYPCDIDRGRPEALFGGLEDHVLGAVGECAVCKYLNVYWSGQWGEICAPDIGGYIDVRAGRGLHHRLMLHHTDHEGPFVFAIVTNAELPRVRLRGWINSSDGKKQEFWETDTGRPAFFVPNKVLLPMNTLEVQRPQLPGQGSATEGSI